MTLTYGSICSGIEAATQAWHVLGWKPAFFAEVDKFPSAVLAHHYGSNMPDEPHAQNGVPNYGDITKFEEWPDHAIDILVGGTPCQDYSIAGQRAGMAGDRGSLTLTFIEIAARYRPKWIVWENVPGVLSSNNGRDFAKFLGDITGTKVEVTKDGWRNAGIVQGIPDAYGVAYRVLDTQFVRVDGFERAIPQRRRRVFVIGHLGGWRCAAAVLFDGDSLRGDTAPIRGAGESSAKYVKSGLAEYSWEGSHWDGIGVHPTLNQSNNIGGIGASNQEIFSQRGSGLVSVAHTLRGEGFDASEDGTGRGTPLVPICFDRQATSEYGTEDIVSTVMSRDYKSATDLVVLKTANTKSNGSNFSTDPVSYTLDGAGPCSIAFNSRQDPEVTYDRSGPLDSTSPQAQAICFMAGQGAKAGSIAASSEVCPTLRSGDSGTNRTPSLAYQATHDAIACSEELTASVEVAGTVQRGGGGGRHDGVFADWRVRRLTPNECHRLQGFPDDFCRIPWRGKPAEECPDGHQYKALGNSMSVNVMRWIGRRIEMVEAML